VTRDANSEFGITNSELAMFVPKEAGMADAQLPDKTIDAKDALLRTDETFRQLVSEHQRLDERIRHLSTFSRLTDQQQYEAASLKKQKLALKDRMETMLRDWHAPTQH
jgi:uncharacterized protein YdcH (DUF465 family)